MTYLILIYHDPESTRRWEGMSDAERAAGLQQYADLHADLVASGALVAAEALADSSLVVTVTSRGGRVITTDGPLAASPVQPAGFFLVECPDRARAVEIAGRIPEAAFGLVEVRPIMSSDAPDR